MSGALMYLRCPDLGDCVCDPDMEEHPVPGWLPPGALSCRDRRRPPVTLNWGEQVGNESSHLFL